MSAIEVPRLREILDRRSGLDLGRGGMEANLVAFVTQRLKLTGLSFERYMEQVDIPGSEELRLLVETMTVVYTWFFRDPGQFRVIQQLIADFTAERTMGIWVAGCATGEEPYSVALIAAELNKRVEILGTDLNSSALEQAKSARYAASSLSAVDGVMRDRYLRTESDYVVPSSVRQTVRFQLGNLVDAAPRASHPEGWDMVICRNVLIYFGQEQARRALDSLAGSLAPGGALVLGASEAILERPMSLHVTGIGGRSILIRPKATDQRTSGARLLRSELRSSRMDVSGAASAVLPAQGSSSGGKDARDSTNLRISAVLPAKLTHRSGADSGEHPMSTSRTQAAIERGHLALEAGDIPVARGCYLEAANLDPTCAEALMFAGVAHYLDGELDQALHRLRGALCLDASLWVACFYQALCYENMGFAEDAARSYSQVVKLASTHAEDAGGHHFLKGWRHDLLAVAHRRANQRVHSQLNERMRQHTHGNSR